MLPRPLSWSDGNGKREGKEREREKGKVIKSNETHAYIFTGSLYAPVVKDVGLDDSSPRNMSHHQCCSTSTLQLVQHKKCLRRHKKSFKICERNNPIKREINAYRGGAQNGTCGNEERFLTIATDNSYRLIL